LAGRVRGRHPWYAASRILFAILKCYWFSWGLSCPCRNGGRLCLLPAVLSTPFRRKGYTSLIIFLSSQCRPAITRNHDNWQVLYTCIEKYQTWDLHRK
jgi:hypothetical protein